ncbi:MAG: DUF599 domain-containing protein [Rhodobacteraceae bacterium]|nr:DUF599 domain-containing protein [Paracoccaceae bacterium]
MTWFDRAALFTEFDLAAVVFVITAWLLMGWWVENPSAKTPSTTKLMAQYRRLWMQEMITRQPRIFDAQIVASLRQGTAFFASTSILALGGMLAVLGNAERLTLVAGDLVQTDAPTFVWEVKILLVILLLTNAFLKFVWANRLFGYVSVVMATVPNDLDDLLVEHRSKQAGEINVLAAQSFNRGLRAVYFALASTAWLAGPAALTLATCFTIGVIWRREFNSKSRQVLLDTRM